MSRLSKLLADVESPVTAISSLRSIMCRLIAEGVTDLPMPGHGRTLVRWRALAAVGAVDLSLAKVYEGHTDARAIVAELSGSDAPEGVGAVWAAEGPDNRVELRVGPEGATLSGRKGWCSGAAIVDHALVTAWADEGHPVIACVAMQQPSVTLEDGAWRALGMAGAATVSVRFDRARATTIGAAHGYTSRPGFWHGGAGIAAVWYGGALAIARTLAASPRVRTDPHAAAHLGAIDASLGAAAAALRECAAWIDAHPDADASAMALRVRATVESAANDVILRTGRALGAAPLCLDAAHAQRCADLAVFLRQSHAERDLAALGALASAGFSHWTL